MSSPVTLSSAQAHAIYVRATRALDTATSSRSCSEAIADLAAIRDAAEHLGDMIDSMHEDADSAFNEANP